MDQSEFQPEPYYGPPPEPTLGQKLKKWLAPLGVILVLVVKFFAKLKFILLPVLKFIPVILKTGGTMLLSILLILILAASVPRLISLFRRKSEAERRYFEVEPWQRWTMSAMYFGLIVLLAVGMDITLIPRETLSGQ